MKNMHEKTIVALRGFVNAAPLFLLGVGWVLPTPALAQTLTDTSAAMHAAGTAATPPATSAPVSPVVDEFATPPSDPLSQPGTAPYGGPSSSTSSASGSSSAATTPVADPGVPPTPPPKKGKTAKPIKAPIRPLPEKYLVVKKERDAQSPDARLAAARSSLSRGEYSVSLELFNELYAQGSKDKRVLLGRAVSMQRLGQNAEAVAAYKEALNNDPKNLEALTNMLGLLRSQDSTSALDGLVQLREIYPFNADITAQLGMAYGEAGDYTQALKYLDMADALKPGNVDVLYNRAVVYDHMGHKMKASSLYKEVLQRAADGSLGDSFPVDDIKRRLAALR